MINLLTKGTSISVISNAHFCSDPNVIKAVNSSLGKAWKFAHENGGIPYPNRTWKIPDFLESELMSELEFLVEILKETEVKLNELVK